MSSYLISQTARVAKAWGVSRSTLCISTIFLLTNVSFNKTTVRRWDWEESPPGQDWSWDNLPGNEKVELSVGNIRIIIIICQTVIYIFTAQTGYVSQLELIFSGLLNYSRCLHLSEDLILGPFNRFLCKQSPLELKMPNEMHQAWPLTDSAVVRACELPRRMWDVSVHRDWYTT